MEKLNLLLFLSYLFKHKMYKHFTFSMGVASIFISQLKLHALKDQSKHLKSLTKSNISMILKLKETIFIM